MKPLPIDWKEVASQVNREVNKLPYKSDAERYGVAEFWEMADKDGGDCEDFALVKFKRLLELGFPAERLRLATCTMGRTGPRNPGQIHAVLVISAPDDEYVLSNGVDRMMTHQDLVSANWQKETIQVADDAPAWMRRGWKVWGVS